MSKKFFGAEKFSEKIINERKKKSACENNSLELFLFFVKDIYLIVEHILVL